MSKGRPPSQKPATAYDYRRYIALVQVLAISESDNGIRHLCEEWNVAPVWGYSETHKGKPYLNIWATIRKLAQHVIEYHEDSA